MEGDRSKAVGHVRRKRQPRPVQPQASEASLDDIDGSRHRSQMYSRLCGAVLCVIKVSVKGFPETVPCPFRVQRSQY
jgi:hypothetical protein